MRRLRVYAFDPQASVSLSTAVINDAVIELPLEKRWETPLSKGPANEYVEVIDVDPASGLFYEPVNLNDPRLLAQDGLAPSEGRPQFHQQMVFAVAMRTIRAFERALGRPVLWAHDKGLKRNVIQGVATEVELNFTRTLRIYPHAIRERNAYYSPEKRALLFGYFRPDGVGARATDASWVFTCLSQDIIAHETTHAILHGMQQRSIESSNIDALAFHEAFADIIALLQHFDARDVVAHLLARSGGSLRTSTLLTGLAAQFGTATGKKGALRHALLDLLKVEADFKEKSGVGGASSIARDAKADARPTPPRCSQGRKRFTRAAVFSSQPCLMRSSRFTRRARPIYFVCRVSSAEPLICPPRWSHGLPTKRRARQNRYCACASVRSIMSPRLICALENTCARSSRPTPIWCRKIRCDIASPFARHFANGASAYPGAYRWRQTAYCGTRPISTILRPITM